MDGSFMFKNAPKRDCTRPPAATKSLTVNAAEDWSFDDFPSCVIKNVDADYQS
jgi:hypothetical protein